MARGSARSEIVEKATRLLDDYGLADLTMRRLARELDVSPGALYWHFADKQELLGAVADRIIEPTRNDDPATSWRDRIIAVGTTLRDALLSTTDGAELVSASFAAGKSTALTAVVSRLAAAATEAGVGIEHAELVARTIIHYVIGFTVDEQSRIQWDAAGALPQSESVLSVDPSARFAFGLGLIVTGVAHGHAAPHPV